MVHMHVVYIQMIHVLRKKGRVNERVGEMNGWGTYREGGVRLIQITEGPPELHLTTSLDHLPVKTHNMSNVKHYTAVFQW